MMTTTDDDKNDKEDGNHPDHYEYDIENDDDDYKL